MQPAAGVGGPRQDAGVGEGVVLQRRAGQEADHQHPEVGAVVEHLRPDARLERGPGVVRARRRGRCRAARRRCRCTARRTSPSGVTTLKLRLVSPPESSSTRTRPDRRGTWSRSCRRASGSRSTVEGLDHGLVDRVSSGPVNHFLADDLPPDRQEQQRAEGDDRGVVDELPAEVVAERHCRRARTASSGRGRRSTISATATRFIHLYLAPLFHDADLEPVAVLPPQPDRDREGEVEADHRDRGDGVERDRDDERRLGGADVDLDQRRQRHDRRARPRPSSPRWPAPGWRSASSAMSEPGDRAVTAEREGHPRRRRHARGRAEELRRRRDEQHQRRPVAARATARRCTRRRPPPTPALSGCAGRRRPGSAKTTHSSRM